MSETKHTPSPWRLDPDCLFDAGICATVEGADGVGIVEIFPSKLDSSSGKWTEEQIANARLIAAAADSIEACRIVKDFLLKLEFGIDIADPLRKFRERIHAPLHAALDKALNKAFARTQPPSITTEATKERQEQA